MLLMYLRARGQATGQMIGSESPRFAPRGAFLCSPAHSPPSAGMILTRYVPVELLPHELGTMCRYGFRVREGVPLYWSPMMKDPPCSPTRPTNTPGNCPAGRGPPPPPAP